MAMIECSATGAADSKSLKRSSTWFGACPGSVVRMERVAGSSGELCDPEIVVLTKTKQASPKVTERPKRY